MRYIAVEWRHEYPDEPVMLYSELDEEGWEVRKVERFRDGHADWAGPDGQSGTTDLGLLPVPSLEEIAEDPEFLPREISAGEFEAQWEAARPGIRVLTDVPTFVRRRLEMFLGPG